MTIRSAPALLAVALIAGSCGVDRGDVSAPPLVTTTAVPEASSAKPTAESTTAQPLPPVVVAQVDCPEELVDDDVACGLVTVPIDRADPGAGTTRITIATMRGYDSGFDTPLAVLQGGPGGASSALSSWFPQQPFTQVFVDQRGTGYIGLDFDCPEIFDALPSILGSAAAEAGDLTRDAYGDCARRLDQDPVLAHTDSEAHAADVADVMAALGYDRWLAYGVSYGSTIGLELMRDEPIGLVGVVLDGVYAPDLDVDAGLVTSSSHALAELSEACSSDAICRSYLDGGDIGATVSRVIAALNAEPMVVSLGGNELGLPRDVDVVLDGDRFAEYVFLLLYSEGRTRYLPAVIGGIDRGEESSARWLATIGSRVVIASEQANDEGTYFAVQCRDRLPFASLPELEPGSFESIIASAPLTSVCDDWEREPAGPEAADPVRSDLPALLLSGRFDPITPPPFATAVASRLGAATVVEQDGRGHGIWFGNECIARIVQSFVADPQRTLDITCAAEALPMEWAQP